MGIVPVATIFYMVRSKRRLIMNQEEKIKEIKLQVSNVEKLVCMHSKILHAMEFNLHPMFTEWRESKQDEHIVSRMFLDE
jgi:hypothetical protein